jgi:hypothetical protein
MPQPLPCRLPLWSRVFVLIACLGLGGNIMVPAARAQEALTVSLTLDAVTFEELGTIVVAGRLVKKLKRIVFPALMGSLSPTPLLAFHRGFPHTPHEREATMGVG